MKSGRQSACKACLTIRKISEYRKHRQRYLDASKRYQAKNKRKYKSHMLSARYGINIDQYETMLTAQNGRCAICKTKDHNGVGKYFHVDHCHKTKKIRGLLCGRCNVMIGMAQDNADRLIAAAAYLRKTGAVKATKQNRVSIQIICNDLFDIGPEGIAVPKFEVE
jgi:hypothetical protein